MMNLDNTKIIFSMKLKQLRYFNHLTQQQLAKQIGISKQAISKLESGQAEPTLYTLVKISLFFECSLDALVFGKVLWEKDDSKLNLHNFVCDIKEIEKTRSKLTEQISSLKKFAEDVEVISCSINSDNDNNSSIK